MQSEFHTLISGGQHFEVGPEISLHNFMGPSVYRFEPSALRTTVVTEFIVHESVTSSVAQTIEVLRARNLGVHLIVGPNGQVTQHGDLEFDLLMHAQPHNARSIGIEVVNPYYPECILPGSVWTRVIDAPWAHRGRYVLPTLAQVESTARLIERITELRTEHLCIPKDWIGMHGDSMFMGRVEGARKPKSGIHGHGYFNHSDGVWPVFYAFLRLECGWKDPEDAYEEAARIACGAQQIVTIPRDLAVLT